MYRELDSSKSILQHRQKSKKRGFLKDYWVEILTLLAISVGIILVIEPIPFRLIFSSARIITTEAFSFTTSWIAAALDQITLANYIGGVVLLLAGAYSIKRIHYRIFSSMQYSAVQCPRCSGSLSRIHRTRFDHLLGSILRVHLLRFFCKHCGWAGLRIS